MKYDEVMNTQRQIIYKWRDMVLKGGDTQALVAEWRQDVVEDQVLQMTGNVDPIEWDWQEFEARIGTLYPSELSRSSFANPDDLQPQEVMDAYQEEAAAVYAGREAELSPEVMRKLERTVVLSIIDNKWREHLAEMDYLRAGIGLRAMGQRDPLVEYQREGFDLFSEVVDTTKYDACRYLYHVEVVKQVAPERPKSVVTNAPNQAAPKTVRNTGKVGRNAPCPCGSGKKYKHCHGKPGAEPLTA